ncbi:MAG: septation protein SepH, partial [Propionibacteriaceae bacterium]|nr:septation protein SepH [Propionibacteriaceae bacterium]
MDSALRPRDIQARIRAGASPQDVAEAAGVPLERIDAFAAPVIAERDYIAGLARTNPVRRRGETTSHRTLRNAVADALAARGQDVDDANWDAWKLEDRRWQVRIGFEDADAPEGLFVFDALGRFSVAANDEGRALIGDGATDDLALVDATQGAAAEPEDEVADEPKAEDEPVQGLFPVAPVAPVAPEVP